MPAIITLTTDFGTAGTYVAAMKAAILSVNPDARLVDVNHGVGAQNVLQGALAIDSVYDFFPAGTVHLVVVDPGVGTARKGIVLQTARAFFVAPDNGVLSYVLARFLPAWNENGGPLEVELPPGIEAFHLSDPRFWHQPVSPTFHGRDVFAPVAAHLSLGIGPSQMGERLRCVRVLPLPKARKTGAEIVGQVIDIDSFGNLTTNIRAEDLPSQDAHITVAICGCTIRGLVHTYAEGEGLLALIGSSGRLEIAVRNGRAAAFLGASVGEPVTVRRTA